MRPVTSLFCLLALCLPGSVHARDLKLATWNLEWLTLRPAGDPELPHDLFPRDAAAVARLRAYAMILNADVVALQEVDGEAAAAEIFPPERYVIHMSTDTVAQRVGFAIRRGLPFTANADDTAIGVRHGLRSGADITLALPGANLRLLAVHLKAGCREQKLTAQIRECAILGEQLAPLRDWVAARRQEGGAFAILGDFNRWMDHDDPFYAELASAAPLLRATEGRSNPCWGGGAFIDHIIAGGPAREWLIPGQLRVLVYRETGPSARRTLSDHCPVSVRLNIPD